MITAPKSTSTLIKILRLLRWHKPAGRLILMLPALWSVVAAAIVQKTKLPWDLLLVVILGSITTSAAGCVINDLWDRDIDPQVERTKSRPLADRSLSLQVGIAVLGLAGICAFLLASYLNWLSFALCLAAVPVIAIYPACKRFFPVPQLVLSIAWGFAVLIPWAAATGALNINAWVLWATVLAWTMGFDTVYAMSDRTDDLRVGVKSSALFFGDQVVRAIASFYALTWLGLISLGWQLNLSYIYYGDCLIAGLIWIWQCRKLAQPTMPSSNYQLMFGQNVWIGFIVLAGMLPAAFAVYN